MLGKAFHTIKIASTCPPIYDRMGHLSNRLRPIVKPVLLAKKNASLTWHSRLLTNVAHTPRHHVLLSFLRVCQRMTESWASSFPFRIVYIMKAILPLGVVLWVKTQVQNISRSLEMEDCRLLSIPDSFP